MTVLVNTCFSRQPKRKEVHLDDIVY